MNYTDLKKAALDRYFGNSNDKQREAIFKVIGNLLIIAGAGSGKTTVLCNRVANLLLFGNAYNSSDEKSINAADSAFLADFAEGKIQINADSSEKLSSIIAVNKATPWKILTVTFTNKAAKELKERIGKMNAPAEDVWATTFHSACVRILRQDIESIGYKKSFTIYDSDDSQRVVKEIFKSFNMSDKAFNPKDIQSAISHAKDKLILPDDFNIMGVSGKPDYRLQSVKLVYTEYQKRLSYANALDFDDLIMKTVELFEKDKDVLMHWQNHFDYIMVDEFQDTNEAQLRLIELLAKKCGNLCVVGDEDQSIYRFRGATIENILSFQRLFNSSVVKLEQNYRSTSAILDAANAVIKNNTQRNEKKLWSALGEGEKLILKRTYDEQDEARFVSEEILKGIELTKKYADHAVLYRTNAQSRSIELALSKSGIPYQIVGGTRFYDRKEIKDIIAYLSIIVNPADTVRFMRIINEPKRGIGDTTSSEIFKLSASYGVSPLEIMARASEFSSISKKAKALKIFSDILYDLSAKECSLDDLVESIIVQTGYKDMLAGEGIDGETRLENIEELKSSMISFCAENENHTLRDFLEQVALISDLDNYQNNDDRVVLMTMHSAKGLEFDTVFIVGAEEGLFPSRRSLVDPADMEEERRIAYVAITRAKRQLYITATEQRLLFGQTSRNQVSRFAKEIPADLFSYNNEADAATKRQQYISTRPSKRLIPGYLQEQSKRDEERSTAESEATESDKFVVGNKVEHKVFGSGIVLSSTPCGGDYLLEIAFEKIGTKKIMANFARIAKVPENIN